MKIDFCKLISAMYCVILYQIWRLSMENVPRISTIHGRYEDHLISAHFYEKVGTQPNILDKERISYLFCGYLSNIYIMVKCTNNVSFGLTLIEVLEQS